MASRSPIHLLTERVNILRPSTQTNDFGLPHLVWQLHLENIPAQINLLDGDSGTATREKLRYKIQLPVETDIRQLDRIQHHDRVFQVLVVSNAKIASHVINAMTTEVHP